MLPAKTAGGKGVSNAILFTPLDNGYSNFVAPMSEGPALSSALSITMNEENAIFPAWTFLVGFGTNCRELICIANDYMVQPICNSKEIGNSIIGRIPRPPVISISIRIHRYVSE
jgi:hypothetical protein